MCNARRQRIGRQRVDLLSQHARQRHRTEAAGYALRERLCVYPEYITGRPEYFDPEMLRRLRAAADPDGYARPHAGGV